METGDPFKEFSARRDLWIRCLNGDDHNSVFNQIYQMIWNAGVFRVINEARKFAPTAKEGGVQLNGMVHRLIDQCFFESQTLAIRRLTDGSYLIEGDRRGRDICSLSALLKDMKQHVRFLTREGMFRAEGLEYDYEAVRQRFERFCLERARTGESAFSVSSELDYRSLVRRHEQLDYLTGVSKERRSPADQMRSEALDFLAQKIQSVSEDIETHVHKFIAHAATPESRQVVSADTARITLGHLWEAHMAICQVANFTDTYLLGRGTHMNFLSTPQFDIFSYLDRPLAGKGDLAKLSEIWDSYGKEASTWSRWGFKEFRNEFESERPQGAEDVADAADEIRVK